jgi:ABC-2 type transport system permease protein
MKRSGYVASVVKEARLLGRDLHGLALLFVLPTVFILIMSLALQGRLQNGEGLTLALLDQDRSAVSADFAARLDAHALFDVAPASDPSASVRAGRADIGVVIPSGFQASMKDAVTLAALTGAGERRPPARIEAELSTGIDPQTRRLLEAGLRETVGRQQTELLLQGLRPRTGAPAVGEPRAREGAEVVLLEPEGRARMRPSAVQQSVPAWLVFAVFFVAIPFSNTYIRERELGVLRRLSATRLSPLSHALGKLTPYFAVNQLQLVLMLMVGVWIVPLLGGEALQAPRDYAGLALIGASISIAALGLALLVSVLARTTEQATLMTGVGAILMAAIGGVMIPRFMMPEAMQAISAWSPMAWGLDGLLELLLQEGSRTAMIQHAAKLVALGASATGLALAIQTRQD